jgi:hypothetical protein
MDFKKKIIFNEINNLSIIEYKEIYKILKDNDCNYTKNNNGIFINLSKLSDFDIELIYNYIIFSKDSKININNVEEVKNNLYIDNINLKNKNNINNNNNNNNIKSENENISNNIIIKNKITSTMKFYILRKKMYKNQINISKLYENELEYDNFFI